MISKQFISLFVASGFLFFSIFVFLHSSSFSKLRLQQDRQQHFSSPLSYNIKHNNVSYNAALRAYDSLEKISHEQSQSSPASEPVEEGTQSQTSFSLLLLLCLEVVCFLFNYVLRQSHFKYLQEAGCTMLIGVLIGGFIRLVSNVKRLQAVITFQPELFFLFFLPPIIFESGYNMKRRAFFQNIDGIVLFALIGTTVATFATGFLLYPVSLAGLMSTKLSLLDCLVWGSLISATDPVTVLAIFKELRVDFDLYSNVFGESALNDAVAIALYTTVVGFKTQTLTGGSLMAAIGSFTLIFVGSVLCGVIVALMGALLFKYTELEKYPMLETAILFLYAYSSYLLADGLGLSGIVSILFCGIVMAHYTYNNLSKEAKELSSNAFQLVALLTETLVFVYLGLSVFSFESSFDFGFIFFGLIIILVARAVHVFPLAWFMNNVLRKSNRRISFRYQIFIWFSGLRGAIAFALSLTLSTDPLFQDSGKSIFTTTLFIIFFTVLILGGTTIPILEKLEIPMGVADPVEEPPELKKKKGGFI